MFYNTTGGGRWIRLISCKRNHSRSRWLHKSKFTNRERNNVFCISKKECVNLSKLLEFIFEWKDSGKKDDI